MQSVLAYIDESGDSHLETAKDGTSNYYIVCAVLIDSQNEIDTFSAMETIRKRHFQTGEIKSSKVSDKDEHHRRIRIIKDIMEVDFHFSIVAVDKAAVHKDSGLQFKTSFIKYVSGLLYNQLYRSYPDLKVVADEHGNDAFKKSFQQYIETNHKPDLFWKSELSLVRSESNVMVQLADFIVGTVAKTYENKSNPALNEQYIELLKNKCLNLVEWPTKYQTYYAPDQTSNKFDRFIYEHALNQAEIFLETNSSSHDEEIQLQVCVLGHLVFKSRISPEIDYISTNILLTHLAQRGHINVTEQTIRSSIIAKLRDDGVIIASSNKGYKIPKCYADFYDFVERVNGQIIPLLDRLNKARNSYMIASKNKIDLLKGPNYPKLVAFLDELNK